MTYETWYEILPPAVRSSGGRWNRPPLVDVVLLFAKSANLKIAGAPLHNSGMFLYQLINGITWNHRGTLFISSSVQKKTFFLLYRGACMWTIHVFLVIMLCTDLYRYQNKQIYVCVSSKQKSNEINWRHWQWFQDLIWFSMPGRIQGGILL